MPKTLARTLAFSSRLSRISLGKRSPHGTTEWRVLNYHSIRRTLPRLLESVRENRPQSLGFHRRVDLFNSTRGLPPNKVRKKYRGIDRVPLIAWPSRRFPDETWVGREEPEASQALDDLETSNGAEEGFIFSVRDARRVYSLLRHPERWELIWAHNSDIDRHRPEWCRSNARF